MKKDAFNIAVCLSGQPRTWRTAKENILQYFELPTFFIKGKQIEVDYFIHCWDTNSLYDKSHQKSSVQYVSLPVEEESEIKKAFNPIDMEFEKYDKEIFDAIGPWAGLFYSFMKSVMLKKEYELQNDFVYDIVIKSRLDLNFHQEGINEKGFPVNKFYLHPVTNLNAYSNARIYNRFPKEMNHPCFDDVFFYGDSPTMDIISNLYRWYKEIMVIGWKTRFNGNFLNTPEFYYGPGTLLYKYLTNWNIYPTAEIGFGYYVVRKEAEEKKLDSINQWKEIYQIWKNWYGDKFGVI